MDQERQEPEASPDVDGSNEPMTREAYDAAMRANRRRLALIGLGTGAVMSLIVLLCIILAIMVTSQ